MADYDPTGRSSRELAAARYATHTGVLGNAQAGVDEMNAEDAADVAAYKDYISTPEGQFQDAYENREVPVEKYITTGLGKVPVGTYGHNVSELTPRADGSYEPVESPNLQLAYSLKTLPLYPFAPLAAAGIDIAEGAALNDPIQAATSVLGLKNIERLAKFAGAAAGAKAMEPSEAQAGGADAAKPWFSRALKASELLSQPRATATQYANTMLNAGNVSKEELEWALKNTPREQQMALDEFRRQLREGVPQPDEVLKGSGKFGTRDAAEWQRDIDAAEQAGDWDAAEALQREWEGLDHTGSSRNMTAYGEYQLPGGSNYKELLITLPNKPTKWIDGSPITAEDVSTPFGRETAERVGSRDREDFSSSHFNEPNVLAHLRMNDREAKTYTPDMIADIDRRLSKLIGSAPSDLGSGAPEYGVRKGVITPLEAAQYSDARGFRNDTTGAREKILHLEEIQSDWHQKGRKEGYKSGLNSSEQAEYDRLNGDMRPYTEWAPSDMDRFAELETRRGGNEQGVPDAPLKKDWPEMAFKRAVKYAADNGYDRVTWTTGAQQADRYNLAKQINTLRAFRNADGSFDLAYLPPGNKHMRELKSGVKDDALEGMLGKDLARKVRGQPDDTTDYSGLDLKVGGEGMKRFYDDQLPRVASKVGKKYGAAYEQYALSGLKELSGSPADLERRLGMSIADYNALPLAERQAVSAKAMADEQTQVHSLRLTPELIESAKKDGMPFMAVAPAAALPATQQDNANMQDGDLTSKIDALEAQGYASGGAVKKAADALSSGAKKAPKRVRKSTDLEVELEALEAQNPRAVIGDTGQLRPNSYVPVNPEDFTPGSLHRQLADGLVPNARTGAVGVPFTSLKKTPEELRTMLSEQRITPDNRYATPREGRIEDIQGQYITPLTGDRSPAGWLNAYGGRELDKPIHMGGGFQYGLGEGQGAWASAKGVLSKFGRAIRDADAPVNGVYIPASGESTDFTRMQKDAILDSLSSSTASRKSRSAFDSAFLASKDHKKKPSVAATYPGINSEELPAWLDANGDNRYYLMKALDKKQWVDEGLPDVAAARMAFSHPSLRGLPGGNESYGGQLITPLVDRIAPTADMPIGHSTYPYDLARSDIGFALETPVERSVLLRDWYAGKRAAGKDPGRDSRSLIMSDPPVQKVDQQLVDAVNESIERSKSEGDINDLLSRYEKGGVVKSIAKQLQSPTPKRVREKFDDWQWRPADEVRNELGLTDVPPHVEDFGRFMKEQQERAQAGDMTARDLLKAYAITVSSMGRGAVNAELLTKRGHPTEQTGLVRPEGAMGDWLMGPAGRAYLDAAERGAVDKDALEDLRNVSHSFGKQNMLVDQLTGAASILPERTPTAIDAIARGDVGSWRGFTNDLPGIDSAKSGFLGAPLGFGKLPTADAREVKLYTGLSTKEAQKFMSRKGWADATVDRIADRQAAMGLRLDPSLEDFRQHLTHHTVWDKVADEKTTHADLMRAMRLAGVAPAAALGAASYGDEAQAAEPSLDDIRAYLAQQDGGE